MNKFRIICRFSAFFVIALCLSGCLSVGPDYEPVDAKTPDFWGQELMQDFQSGTNANMQSWWTIFNDEILSDLILTSSTNNPDLMIAAERIVEAAALRGIAKSLWFPQVSGDGIATINESAISLLPGGDTKSTQYSIGGSMGWELDVWGRVRRTVEASDASMQATVEDYRDTMVMLYAEIAYQYIQVRALQSRIALAKESIVLQSDTFNLTKDRNTAGLAPDLDVYQAKMNLAQTEATIPPLRILVARAIHRLSVLSGKNPSALVEHLQIAKENIPYIPIVPAEITVGLPADLLRQRPDVRSAERRLAAQHAMIGAKKAELYPTFTLPGTFALQGYDIGDISDSGMAYSFGPAFRWNLFNGGRIRSMVVAEESKTKQASINYERVVLKALEDVENAMVSIREERLHIVALNDAVVASRKSVELVKDLYRSGLTDFQNVLTTERSYMFQQDKLAEAEGAVAGYAVQLYKALGGGWSGEEVNNELSEKLNKKEKDLITERVTEDRKDSE